MKKTLLFISAIASFSLATQKTTAQNLQTISIQSGFNADVVANGVGTSASSTNNDVDGVNFAFVARDFQLTSGSTALTYGLPNNGLINSAVPSPAGLSYQLASYSGNNALRLQNANDAGTLVFTTPIAAVNLYMLATGGSGSCIINATVNFSDATTQTFTGISISDWYGGTNFAIQGIGRINRTNDVLENGGGTNPRLYQIPLAISSGNQPKLIESVTVTKVSGGVPNVFAFSADAYTSCPGPTNITYTSTTDGGVFNWTAPASAPSMGYDYYYSDTATPPTASTTPSGSVGAGVTTVTLTGLNLGVPYYFWVRSNCDTVQGFWQMKTFTTGQMVFTYTAGDINTEYTLNEPTITSTTACTGTLNVTVPSGFQIGSTDVAYTMTTASNGWMSEQRTLLVCTTNNTTEAAITSGVGGTTGTYAYNRTGLSLANGLSGAVSFDLRAWRTYGGSGCNADYNRVNNNSWKITITLTDQLSTAEVTQSKIKVYPVPFTDVIYLDNAQEVKTILVTETTGKLVRTIENPQPEINLSDLNSGLYILSMMMQDGSTQHTKTIKK
ncbi:T9SS type A sorting domain-containing protein [Flavobacterium capsici]|uniref:T9SS type A sorting domain-containing protein n=1 Tax=Flavobacterium capsici TaxID=3075618 RepID=A0AA96EUN1_9FLAO|nr:MULTISPECIES: T9SS type A sorting domain-containing protein [unclassified Flavobacterium]WNM18699.1 T9SS type A sorting domain-containing protein [Flavobacterium sp. PMR2A8]WNM22750.1 T9SS type A sorting domain-containing protein [Flavobacterium sp. PMTSA4]